MKSLQAITYRNTKTTLPGFADPVHEKFPIGLAYETSTHFVHFYGSGSNLYTVQVGITVTEEKTGSLHDWAVRVFGADDINNTNNPVGHTVRGVWRPGLYFFTETLAALDNSESEQRASEQSLRLLVERLDELLLYIEPSPRGLEAYSNKTRELLILACTEFEDSCMHYMPSASASPSRGHAFCTNDYVKLLKPLYLAEFEIKVKPYSAIAPIRPFGNWNAKAPTQSLSWYDAYNKTKHNRSSYFGEATLANCLSAIAANLCLFCVRFSPFPLLEGPGILSSLVNQMFDIRLQEFRPETAYIPLLELPPGLLGVLQHWDSRNQVQAWTVLPFKPS